MRTRIATTIVLALATAGAVVPPATAAGTPSESTVSARAAAAAKHTVTGRTVGADGKGVSGIEITAFNTKTYAELMTKSAADGSFKITVPAGVYVFDYRDPSGTYDDGVYNPDPSQNASYDVPVNRDLRIGTLQLGGQAAPKLMRSTQLRGPRQVGRVLKAVPATWSETTDSITFRWYRNDVLMESQKGPRLKLKPRDRGKRIMVAVVGHWAGHDNAVSYARRVVKVVKARSKVDAAVSNVKAPSRKRLTVTADVAARGIRTLRGRVFIKDGKRRVATATLRPAAKGVVEVTLPRLRPGKHELRAVFSGNRAVRRGASAATTVTVTR